MMSLKNVRLSCKRSSQKKAWRWTVLMVVSYLAIQILRQSSNSSLLLVLRKQIFWLSRGNLPLLNNKKLPASNNCNQELFQKANSLRLLKWDNYWWVVHLKASGNRFQCSTRQLPSWARSIFHKSHKRWSCLKNLPSNGGHWLRPVKTLRAQ